ncbi:MAG TPA: hypothetical protein ENN27_03160 [Candidatus Atribacteria bacterium]|nr:hypothetical protein [Candidatus Atribacteria bacterium]
MNKFIIVAYYTKNTGYEDEIKKLITSLEKFNLPYDIKTIDNLGNWQKNTQYKAEFCKRMLEKHQRPIVYLDADARVEQNPELFEKLDCDIAVHYRNDEELLSGTLYLNNTYATKMLIDEWIKEIKKTPDIWEQKVLDRVIRKSNIKIEKLPPTYCQIFDSMAGAGKPVISQHQASRKFKEAVNVNN